MPDEVNFEVVKVNGERGIRELEGALIARRFSDGGLQAREVALWHDNIYVMEEPKFNLAHLFCDGHEQHFYQHLIFSERFNACKARSH